MYEERKTIIRKAEQILRSEWNELDDSVKMEFVDQEILVSANNAASRLTDTIKERSVARIKVLIQMKEEIFHNG